MAGPGEDNEIIYLYISEFQSSFDTYLLYYLEQIFKILWTFIFSI